MADVPVLPWHSNGHFKARAARALGLTQRQIGYRIKKFRLDRPDYALAEERFSSGR